MIGDGFRQEIEAGPPMVELAINGEHFRATIRQFFILPRALTEPDPKWECTDKAGHVHRYEKRGDDFTTPTLIKQTRTEVDEYEGDSWEVEYLACLECGEEVKPGRRYVPQGIIPHSFDGEYSGPLRENVRVPGEIEVGDLIPGLKGKATVTAYRDEHMQGRTAIVHIVFQGQGLLDGVRNFPGAPPDYPQEVER